MITRRGRYNLVSVSTSTCQCCVCLVTVRVQNNKKNVLFYYLQSVLTTQQTPQQQINLQTTHSLTRARKHTHSPFSTHAKLQSQKVGKMITIEVAVRSEF